MKLVWDFIMADQGIAVSNHFKGETVDPSLEWFHATSQVKIMHVQKLCAFVTIK